MFRGMKLGTIAALAVFALLVVGCGAEQETSEPEGESGGGSATRGGSASGEETTEDTVRGTAAEAASGRFQGVVASYEVAQSEIDEEGSEQEVGEYRVGYIVELAEGWWEGTPGSLTWREPASGETNHVEILPFEAETGLLVPGMQITLTILDGSGNEVESKPLDFYRGEFYHYANNFSLPQSGTYALRAELIPPEFKRHGDEEGEGKVFTEPVTVEFENVEINTEEE